MVRVRRIGSAARTMISQHITQLNTARSARITVNIAICRTFMRSVFFVTTTRGEDLIDRSRGYRPPTNA